MKTKTKILAVAVAILLSFGLVWMTSCQLKVDENELVVMTQFGGEDPQSPAYQVGVKAFKDSHPGIKLTDKSFGVAEGTDSIVETAFAGNATSHPDVVYHFSPSRNDSIKQFLASVADIKSKYADYGKGFTVQDSDPYTLNFTGNTFGMFYKEDAFETTDFESYTSLISKLKSPSISGSKIVNFSAEPHYWFNYIGINKMGDKWSETPDKAWFEKYKTEIIGVIDELKIVFSDIGLSSPGTIQYSEEKAQLWNGERVFAVEGNWSAGGFYDPGNGGEGYKIATLPFDNDTDDNPYVLAGYFSGWMISKNAFNNAAKLKNAVEFIQAQLDNVTLFAGVAANGASASDDKPLVAQAKAIAATPNAKVIAPLDDRIQNAAAKAELYSKLTGMLQGGKESGESIVNSVLSMF